MFIISSNKWLIRRAIYSNKIKYINKMDIICDPWNGMYEVEKIINCKIYKNKKYYLIKWLCYPIYESTWEPKSNLKNLNYMIEAFEREYPYSVDQNMYEIYCDELKKRLKRKNKAKIAKKLQTNIKFLSKKKKIEYFSDSELKDLYLDKLKIHLHLNLDKRYIKARETELVVDLSSSATQSDENTVNQELDKEKMNVTDEKNNYNQLIMPIVE